MHLSLILFLLLAPYVTVKPVSNGETPDIHRQLSAPKAPEISWTVAAPSQPLVTCSIISTGWTLLTQTGTNASLSALVHTRVLLICVAKHPVLWYKKRSNGKFEPITNQTREYNPYLEKPDNYSSNRVDYADLNQINKGDVSAVIQAIWEYNAWATIQNMSQKESGEYICASPMGFTPTTPTMIRLSTHMMPESQEYSQIIQTGFDKVLTPTRAPYYGFSEEHINISTIYSTPHESTLNHSVFFPSILTTFTPEDQNNVTFSEYFKIRLVIAPITPTISKSTLVITKGGRTYKAGMWTQLVFRSELSNGTIIERWWEVDLCKEAYSPNPLDSIDGVLSKVLVAGEPYEVTMYVLTKGLAARAFLVSVEYVFDGATCPERLLLANQSMEICGVEGFSRINSESWDQYGESVGISFFIRPKRPCAFEVALFTSVDNILLPMQSDVFVIAALNLTSVRSNSSASERRDLQLLVNESITLECLVPACQMELVIGWCKLTYKVEHETLDSSDMDVCTWFPGTIELRSVDPPWENNPDTLVDPSIRTAIKNVDQSTRSYQIVFNPIALNHSGYFACVHHQRWMNTKKISSEGVFQILVQDPIPPMFPDGQEGGVEDVVIKRGTIASLNCQVEGLPAPSVKWTWNDQPLDLTGNEFIFPTLLTLSVDREGVFACIATNGHGENSRVFRVRYGKDSTEVALGVGIAFGVLVMVGSSLAIQWWTSRRASKKKVLRQLAAKLKSPPEFVAINPDMFLNDQTDTLAYNRQFEIERSSFTVFKDTVLGSGAYGIVYKGRYENMDVAVKVVRDGTDLLQYKALIDEATILSNIPVHINVLGLIAACTDELERNEDLCILTELCSNGSLLSYLQQNRLKFMSDFMTDTGQHLGQPGAVEILLNFAYQAALGMQHLATSKIVHRDLALRNLLLTEGYVVKIGDYGLAGRYLAKNFNPSQPMPALWMAVESFEPERQFSLMSDVWSFGVVLWEMLSCGEQPYSEYSSDFPFRVGPWLRANDENRLGLPKIACDDMYHLMRSCWNSDRHLRPSFRECKRIIGQILERKSASSYQAMVSILNSAWLKLGKGAHKASNPAVNSVEVAMSDCQPALIAVSGLLLNDTIEIAELSWSHWVSEAQATADYTLAIGVALDDAEARL